MPVSARANQTFHPRTRRAAVSALAVAALAGSAAGCAATSSGATSASSSAPASTPAASAGTGTKPAPAGSPAPASPGSAASCAANPSSVTATAPAGANAGVGQGAPALAAVQFTDPGHGWVAGAGRIMATSNGGASWSRQYAGSADLDQVDFIDSQHGWAAGGGALLRTTNGGASWAALAEPCQGDLTSVHFVSPAVGYAVAAKTTGDSAAAQPSGGQDTTALGGSLVRTTDGGSTWSPVAGAPANPQSACFANADDGYLGTPARIWRTTDGGSTWSPVAGAPANPQSACFASADDGYLGTPARIWRTTDGGQHWTLALTEPTATGNPAANGTDTPEIECAGASGLWALFLGQGAAMEHEPYLAYASQDGRAWHGVLEQQYTESALRPALKLPEGPGSYPGPFSAIDGGSAVFVGYTPPLGYGAAPVMLASDNGYHLDGEGNVGAINQPMAAAFLSQDQGWVVGENLKTHAFDVEATSDAGRSWTTQYTVG
jgi:photosystem II stability/assembly factor-like uncharacterized protein